MKKYFVNHLALLFLFIILISACTSDKLPEPSSENCVENLSYNDQIKSIIDNSCALSGCHDASGLAPGNYLSYNSMLGNLENGMIQNRVINLRDMPVAPGELNEEDFEKIKCWITAGFPE